MRNTLATIFFILLLLCGLMPSSHAQKQVEGQLLDGSSIPIPRVEVLLVSLGKKTTTDEAGFFKFTVGANFKLSSNTKFEVNGYDVPQGDVIVKEDEGYVFITISKAKATGSRKAPSKPKGAEFLVQDSTQNALADVSLLIGSHPVTTDAEGKFILEEEHLGKSVSVKNATKFTLLRIDTVSEEKFTVVLAKRKSAEDYSQDFNNALEDLDAEKKMLAEQGEKLQNRMQEVAAQLAEGGKDLSEKDKNLLAQQVAQIQARLSENMKAFEDAQAKTRGIVSDINAVISEKDSINQATAEKMEQLATEKEAQEKEFQRNLTIALILLALASVAVFVFVRISGRLKKQRNELEDANSKLEYQFKTINRQNEELEQQAENLMQANTEITAQKDLIEKKNARITSSIVYASRIQGALLPRRSENTIKDHFIYFRPKDIVSGDFYWFANLGDLQVLIAGDCTGHGVPGAFMSIMANDILNEIIQMEHITEPEQILTELDARLIAKLNDPEDKGKKKIDDGLDMAVVVLNKPKAELKFAGAKNPLYYVQDKEMKVIKGSKFPVGSTQFKIEKEYPQHVVQLNKGDTFYIFSDGYQDQFGGHNGEKKFLTRRFRKFLHKTSHLTMQEQAKRLENELLEWMGEYKQTDDILVMGFRF